MKSSIASFLFLFLSLVACEKDVYFNIPQNERPILKNNDMVFFTEDKQQDIDTFLIYLSEYYEVSDKRYYHENIKIRYKPLNKKLSIPEFEIIQEGSISISTYWYYYPAIYEKDNTTTINFNGVTYPSVYTLYNSFNWPDSVPETVFYTKQQGLIGFRYKDNRTFELKK